MLALDELVAELGYLDSPHYYTQTTDFGPETAHLFRAAQEIGIRGTYVIRTRSEEGQILSAQPIVYVADIQTEDVESAELQVRKIHRGLWNLCFAPFIILKLPHQIRVYTGFNYSETEGDIGQLEQPIENISQLPRLIESFSAAAIDTGQIWTRYARQIQSNQRVDEHLLANLRKLGMLLKDDGLRPETAHSLIGKYVFLSYLEERDILSREWLAQQAISYESIFTRQATRSSLKQLIEALSDFNGKIFPIDFADESLQDRHISWVAAIFKGDEPSKNDVRIWQLHLDFKAYDFRYIPVETLSAIYEQFLINEDENAKQEQGVVYTPEFLADYLLSEVASVKPLKRGMKILDPACGSGIFLVLTYRRLIESSLGGKTTPDQLREILLESIYGIERKRDACYVTEFSLILTLLHYSEPSQLQDLTFKLPDLHNTHIFECDFFDFEGDSNFWAQNLKFDWIVGNPPWVESPNTKDDQYVQAWFRQKKNKTSRPTGGKRVVEAFSWVVTDLLQSDGVVGLLLPATSLVNLESQEYRRQFFARHEVYRITNFANFRDVLFGKKNSGVLPAAMLVYRLADENRTKPEIIHYAPFVATQQTTETNEEPWIITINESEIQTISPVEAEQGETSLWKLALWGTPYDKRAIERLQYLFPTTLTEYCRMKGWGDNLPCEGIQLPGSDTEEKVRFLPELVGTKKFNTVIHNKNKPRRRFSMSQDALEDNERHFLRLRGGTAGLSINFAPHIVISPGWQNFAIYSEENFIISPRQMGIATPDTLENKNLLRALTVYLSSNLVAYYLFFHVPQWGVFSQRRSVVTTEVRKIPTPIFTPEQTEYLADLHREIVVVEQERITAFVSGIRQKVQRRLKWPDDNDLGVKSRPGGLPAKLNAAEKREYDQFVRQLHLELQTRIDETVFEVLAIPRDIQLLVQDFIQYRLPLDKSAETKNLIRIPSPDELLAYAKAMQNSLDDFAMGVVYHRVSITYSGELIECIVELTDDPAPVNRDTIQFADITMAGLLSELDLSLREQVSQWVYVQRGLRLFDGPRVYLYKSPRVIDWTYTQALNDASDIIGSSLMEQWGNREAEPA